MRRALASLLLAVIGLPLITPLLLADLRPELPACCRRDGKHHCSHMQPDVRSAERPGFAFTAPRCPLFPKAIPVAQGIKLCSIPFQTSVEHFVREPAIGVQDKNRDSYSTGRTRRGRSPPHFTFFG